MALSVWITHLLLKVNLWKNKCNICKAWRGILNDVLPCSSSLVGDLCWPVDGWDGRRARWLPEWNEHIWDCKPCMAWILIVKDYLIVDPQWQLSTQPSPNLTASPCHTKILIGHSNMSKMSLIINKIKSHKLIFSYLMYDMKWESKTGTCIFLL